MELKDRMAGIDANLDDLQSGMEATLRATDALLNDTSKFEGLVSTPVLRSVLRQVKELLACARDQREALQELREGVARLQEELKRSNGAFRPPPVHVGQRQQG